MTTEELITLSDKVQSIMETEAREEEYALFDSLVEKYNEDEGMDNYPNGYYLTENSDYDAPEVIEALFEMAQKSGLSATGFAAEHYKLRLVYRKAYITKCTLSASGICKIDIIEFNYFHLFIPRISTNGA